MLASLHLSDTKRRRRAGDVVAPAFEYDGNDRARCGTQRGRPGDDVYDDELGCVTGHFGPINTLCMSPTGRSFASGGEEGYMRINHLPENYFTAFEKKTAEAFGRPDPFGK